MKNVMTCLLFVLLVAVMAACGTSSNPGARIVDAETSSDTTGESVVTCQNHQDCLEQGYTWCVYGTCEEPINQVGSQPTLPDVQTGEEDAGSVEDVQQTEDVVEPEDTDEVDEGEVTEPECQNNEQCVHLDNLYCADNCQMMAVGQCVDGECQTVEQEMFECSTGCLHGACLPQSECELDLQCVQSGGDFCSLSNTFVTFYGTGECLDGQCVGEFQELECVGNCSLGECLECYSDQDCADEYSCTTDHCVAGVCVYEQQEDCCESNQDCEQTNYFDCMGSTWAHYGNTGNCVNNVCETFSSGVICEFGCNQYGCVQPPECFNNTGCEDGNPCTQNLCNAGECLDPQPILGCCNSDEQCGQGGGCGCVGNTWTCSGSTGSCVDNACEVATEQTFCENGCGDAGCEQAPACLTDWDCKDFNACTDDVCSGGECSNPVIPGAVGVPCGESHVCQPSGDCQLVECISAGQCEDFDPCTEESCSNSQCVHEDKCEYSGEAIKLTCDDHSDCEGSGMGEYCVYSIGADKSYCQVCANETEQNYPCEEGYLCHWGVTGQHPDYFSHYWCQEIECDEALDCDDEDPCTTEICSLGECFHNSIEACEVCDADSDCQELSSVCSGNALITYSGTCEEGLCEQSEEDCSFDCVEWSDESQYCAECEVNDDCSFGQVCTENKLCGWMGNLQCKFICPEGKHHAVVWYGNDLQAEVLCDEEIWTFPQGMFSSWGDCHPEFRFNLVTANGIYGDGDLAELQCNASSSELDLEHVIDGVMEVTLSNVFTGLPCQP
jgi:hypothetical protein